MKLNGKVALITGGAQGIGYACVERLLADGAKVMIADIDAAQGVAARDTLAASGYEGAVGFVETDTGDATAVEHMVSETVSHFGGLHILVNNAAILVKGDILELSEADFDRVYRVNLRGYFLCSQAAARHMVAAESPGSIINMSSVQALITIPNILSYAVCKGGVKQLTTAMALALATRGVRVNAIGPGTIMTDMARQVLADPETQRTVMSRTPMGRAGEPSEIASIVSFLASDDASYITGETIYADGGRLGLNYTCAPPQTA